MASKTSSAPAKLHKKAASTGSASLGKSHRSFQPVLPCGNKLLQQKWDKTYFDEHRRLVRAAKPMVDTRPPQVRPHVKSKWKKQQMEKERSQEIDRDNYTLLKKMQQIMKTEGGVDHKNTYRHHSLNELKRQREMERVSKENLEMLKRLEKVEPIYKVTDWIDDWRKKEELTEMITTYPNEYQASRPISRSKSSQSPTHSVAKDKKVETDDTSKGKVDESASSQVEQDSEQPSNDLKEDDKTND